MLFLAEIDRGVRFRVLALGARAATGSRRVPYFELRAALARQCACELAQLDRILAYTKDSGPPFALGKARPLTDTSLYELRTRRGTRLFWVYGPARSVILLNGFRKQGWGIPRQELQRAQAWEDALAHADVAALTAYACAMASAPHA